MELERKRAGGPAIEAGKGAAKSQRWPEKDAQEIAERQRLMEGGVGRDDRG